MKRILLWDISDEIMLVVEHPSGVVYQNQVGGVACWQAEQEGVLCPLDFNPGEKRSIANCPYAPGREGFTEEIADMLDAIWAASVHRAILRVDRARLARCWEAWVYVCIESPQSESVTADGVYQGPLYGFGTVRGVLTWQNSD